ncbi:MAG: hypothetical protein Q7U59_10430 [Lutibacter sp.]|nr:hypothetical protein [Lutibacter sp.]
MKETVNWKCQNGFSKKALKRGQQGRFGAVSKMDYKFGKRNMLLTETFASKNLAQILRIKKGSKFICLETFSSFLETKKL